LYIFVLALIFLADVGQCASAARIMTRGIGTWHP
jgi:hypothetical protein